MEACATAHYWARELTKLGHEVRLMPAKDVKAYVKRNKNDAADAICEAVRRPTMRFVQVKSAAWIAELTTPNGYAAKSSLGNDSAMPNAPASNGCSQPKKPAPKWATHIPTLPKSHNHCAGVLVRTVA